MGDGYCCRSENGDTRLADILSPSQVRKHPFQTEYQNLGTCTNRLFPAEHSASTKRRHGVDETGFGIDSREVVIKAVLIYA